MTREFSWKDLILSHKLLHRIHWKGTFKWKVPSAGTLGALAIVIAVGVCGLIADYIATPRLALTFRPENNRFDAVLKPGIGPLAPIVFRASHLVVQTQAGDIDHIVDIHSGHLATAFVAPGTTTTIRATVQGPLIHAPNWKQSVSAPVVPKISVTRTGTTTEKLQLNVPIKSAHITSGPSSAIISVTPGAVMLRRPLTHKMSLQMRITSVTGEQSTVFVTVPAVAPAKKVYFGSSSGRHIYITMDDGWNPSRQVLKIMRRHHVPITTFLIENAAKQHLQFWRDFVNAGGTIEDHTVSHPQLTKISPQNAKQQWNGPVRSYAKWFGQTPTLGRPPYGAIDKSVQSAATAAGLRAVIMWSASFNSPSPSAPLDTWNGGPLEPGEIVLLHWQPGAAAQLNKLLALCKTNHLVPASLLSGLPKNYS